METLGLVLFFIALVLLYAAIIFLMLKVDKTENKVPSIIIGSLLVISFSCLIYSSSIMGAYNQMRGKYEITYKVDDDMQVTDTIIHVK